MDLRRPETGASLIGVLIALAILCLLVFASARIYMGERQTIDKETAKALEESGVQTHSNGSVLQSARKKIAENEKLNQARTQEIDKIQ